MKKIVLLILSLLLEFYNGKSQTVGLIQHDSGSLDEEYVLFAPINSDTTHLIDKCGRLVKTWTSTYKAGQSAYLLSDGTLFRTGNMDNPAFQAGGQGGIVEKMSDTINDMQKIDTSTFPNGIYFVQNNNYVNKVAIIKNI